MITEEQINKIVTLAVHEAWRAGTNTTLNDTVGYVVKYSLVNTLLPVLEEILTSNNELFLRVNELEALFIEDDLPLKEEDNVSKEGGLQKSRGRPKAI